MGLVPALPPPPPAVVRAVDCDTAARTASFEGDMRAVAGARRLQMRFSVESEASGADAAWQRVQAPKLDTWVSARPGRSRYVYTKHVAALQPGNAYRVVVRFRWRAADGSVLDTVTRRSKACRIPDPRANLVPVRLRADGGTYTLTVANKGRTTAPASFASLDVGDTALPDEAVPELPAGARFEVTFSGPACAPATLLAATVDATGLVDEAIEADDVLTVACNAR